MRSWTRFTPSAHEWLARELGRVVREPDRVGVVESPRPMVPCPCAEMGANGAVPPALDEPFGVAQAAPPPHAAEQPFGVAQAPAPAGDPVVQALDALERRLGRRLDGLEAYVDALAYDAAERDERERGEQHAARFERERAEAERDLEEAQEHAFAALLEMLSAAWRKWTADARRGAVRHEGRARR